MERQFEIWWNNLPEDHFLKARAREFPSTQRHVKDAFDMGVAFGMDEMVSRIKDSQVLTIEQRELLVKDLDQ